MLMLNETTIDNQIGYEILDDETGELKVISYTAHTIGMYNYKYIIMYDSKMEIISSAFDFLNYHMSDKAYNTRHKAAQALKLLYSYEKIFDKKLKEFKKYEINNLKSFLRGTDISGRNIKLVFNSSRANSTINSYLSVYREYLSYLGFENKWLSQRIATASYYNPHNEQTYSSEKYSVNEKTGNNMTVNKYISVQEFEKIIEVVSKDYSVREEIIIRLMFETGLRIGEVLGLTFEDLVVIEEEGESIPVGYIRNRFSDKPFQKAKTCISVFDKKHYTKKEYKTKGVGYQMVILPSDLLDKIDKYINEMHGKARQQYKDNYFQDNSADSVTLTSNNEDNFYVFINKYGRPLSQDVWNRVLREIFTKSNIQLDKTTRQNNLNHRFRHGFAMFNVQYLDCNELDLMNRMRHSSIQSVSSYYNPTIQDQLKIKSEFASNLESVLNRTRGDEEHDF